MPLLSKCPLLFATVLLTSFAGSDCLPVEEARKHVGEVKCVTGRVVRVKDFLDFCDDFRLCPSTVVIFPGDLKSVGDVRQLQGRMVEVRGQVKEYDGRAEIVLEEYRQLGGAGARIPPVPKTTTSKKGPLQRGNFQPPQGQAEDLQETDAYPITQSLEDPEQ
jgi:hypothetical protein